jgi:hypothetical protein
MKKEILEKWIETLRSGEYQQGNGKLRSGKHYCCLGVLCEAAGMEKSQDYISVFKLPDGQDTTGTGTLGTAALKYLGMAFHTQETLIALNDDQRLNFDQIAQWIEGKKDKLLEERGE